MRAENPWSISCGSRAPSKLDSPRIYASDSLAFNVARRTRYPCLQYLRAAESLSKILLLAEQTRTEIYLTIEPALTQQSL
jgi:hypothetical protein